MYGRHYHVEHVHMTDTAQLDPIESVELREPLLSQKTVAKLLDLSPRSLEAWRLRGDGPPFVRISKRCVRYRRSEVELWLSSRAQQARK